MCSANEALRTLGEAQRDADLDRYAGTFGWIKALVEMVADGSRAPAEILPRIQEAIAEHERDDKAARAEFRQRQAELVKLVKVERAELDRLIADGDGNAATSPPSQPEPGSPPVEVHREARDDFGVVRRAEGWTEGD